MEEQDLIDRERLKSTEINLKRRTTIQLGSDVSEKLLNKDSDSNLASQISLLSGEEKTKKRRKRSKAPFLKEFGIAIENFFKLECSLIAMFTVLSCLAAV